jgi:hypothetical protein
MDARALIAKLSRLDRRAVFAAIAVVVVLPFLSPIDLRATPSGETLAFDAAIEKAIASGKPLLIDVDFGPQTIAEMEPMLLALLDRVFTAKCRVVFITFMPEASSLLRRYLEKAEAKHGLKYGEDYVFLGYASAYAYTMYGMGTNIGAYFHSDDRGTKIAELPLMRNVKSLKDVSAVVNIASNSFPTFWVQYSVAPFGFDFIVGATAVNATDYYPYLQTGQIKGLLAGGRAAAEYEGILVDRGILPGPGDATRGLGSQSLALAVILAFIAIGNAAYFLGRRGATRGVRP